MLKTRLIGVLVLKNDHVVQSIGFKRFLPVGSLAVSLEYLNKWGIDEIVVLDIEASRQGRRPNFDLISSVSHQSQTPLTVGGGVSSVEDMDALLRAGADKVVVNSEYLRDPRIIELGASYFGSQCMVVSIDFQRHTDGVRRVFSHDKVLGGGELGEALRRAEQHGAGEVFLNSVDRDGMKCGYDMELIRELEGMLSIPIIHCGGAGHANHVLEAVQAGIQAVAVGNYFSFTEMSVVATKQLLKRHGCNVRLDTYATYDKANLNTSDGRVTRLAEPTLDDLRFEYFPEEII